MARTQIGRLALAFAVAAALTAAPRAQGENGGFDPKWLRRFDPETSEPGRRFFDGVVAMINDRAILESSIRREVVAEYENLNLQQKGPPPQDLENTRRRVLRRAAQDEILAQTAKTSTANREQLEEYVERQVREFRDQEVQRYGSFNQYTRELGLLGSSWESVAEERRNEVLRQLSLADAFAPLRGQAPLLVTPKELRRYFETHRAEFEREASADVGAVIFPFGGDAQAARRRATEAVRLWREKPLDSEELARQTGGIARPDRKAVRNVPEDSNAAFLKAFAAQAQAGEVSEPLEQGGTVWVLRILARNGEVRQAFADPKVQERILERLMQDRYREREAKLILRNQNKLYFYPENLFEDR
ncbi:MAG: peptidyl-prolyl cis-trans isomerase [Planctomycetes bacterium]|nr:peptidyl-prolyl cis-trans isomerase [Planctomycetota bacterium]